MNDISKIQAGLFSDVTKTQQSPAKTESLGQQDFIKLLVTQMSHQDPMDPQDPGEFLGQLAQFGTVDGVQRLNEAVTKMNDQMESNQALHASAMVGRSVHIASDIGVLTPDKGLKGAVSLSEAVTDLNITITNPQGEIIKKIPMGNKEAGVVDFSWNGLSEDSKALPVGGYVMKAEANINGRPMALSTQAVSNVDSVTIGQNGQGITLNLDGIGAVKMADIEKIA